MNMGVGETRNRRSALEIDGLGVRAGETANFIGGARGDDAPACAGDGLAG